MKWKRESKGVYVTTCRTYRVRLGMNGWQAIHNDAGDGTPNEGSWRTGREKKREAQEACEEHAAGLEIQDRIVASEEEDDDRYTPMQSLDAGVRDLRLSVSHLAETVGILALEVKRLREAK